MTRTHQTQWAAQFAVASELCKRGYQVALTLGNHPSIDLMVVSPKETQFVVDVKGQYSEKFWPISPKEIEGLFYIFAFVPEGKPNQFYILTQEAARKEVAKNDQKWVALDASNRIGKPNPMPGVYPRALKPYQDCWDILPK
jgi:hypothetical protein